MDGRFFDTSAQHATVARDRRATLAAMSTAGLAAIAPAFTAQAKMGKKRKSDKAMKQCEQHLAECTTQAEQCAAQVEQCTTFFTDSCPGEANCTEQIACCAILGSCDVNTFFACLVTAGA